MSFEMEEKYFDFEISYYNLYHLILINILVFIYSKSVIKVVANFYI